MKVTNKYIIMFLKENFVRCELGFDGQLKIIGNPVIYGKSKEMLMGILKTRGYNINASTIEGFLK